MDKEQDSDPFNLSQRLLISKHRQALGRVGAPRQRTVVEALAGASKVETDLWITWD